jgi:glyoxylase-like metal-dependent hydrolase (beta-lactamase superfamily II)
MTEAQVNVEQDRHAWETPGTYLVRDGVYRIPLPLPGDALKSVNVYAIEHDEGIVLIDAGQHLIEARTALERGLSSLGFEFGDISSIYVTHIHRDHYTQAVALRREFDIPISIGVGEERSFRRIKEIRTSGRNHQTDLLVQAGAATLMEQLTRADSATAEEVDSFEMPNSWLVDDEKLILSGRELRVMATPGHTQGHVVFIDATHHLLFAGDHILPHITPSIGFEPVRGDLPLGDFMSSLAKVRSLPDLELLPAHGPTHTSAHHRIDQLLDHHETRLSQSLAHIVERPRTAWEVAGLLRWTRRERQLSELDLLNQFLATMETQFHLDLLVDRNRATKTSSNSVSYYLATSDPHQGREPRDRNVGSDVVN